MVSRPIGRTKSSRFRLGFALAALIILAILVFLAGCVTDTPEPGNSHSAPMLVVHTQEPGESQVLMTGLWSLKMDRRYIHGVTKPGSLPSRPLRLRELQTLLMNADFPSLAPSYPAPSPGADYFHYTITYREKTVTTETGGVPDALLAVIGRLDALLADYAPIS